VFDQKLSCKWSFPLAVEPAFSPNFVPPLRFEPSLREVHRELLCPKGVRFSPPVFPLWCPYISKTFLDGHIPSPGAVAIALVLFIFHLSFSSMHFAKDRWCLRMFPPSSLLSQASHCHFFSTSRLGLPGSKGLFWSRIRPLPPALLFHSRSPLPLGPSPVYPCGWTCPRFNPSLFPDTPRLVFSPSLPVVFRPALLLDPFPPRPNIPRILVPRGCSGPFLGGFSCVWLPFFFCFLSVTSCPWVKVFRAFFFLVAPPVPPTFLCPPPP